MAGKTKEYRRKFVSINVWALLDRIGGDGGTPINFLERAYWSGGAKPKAHISVVLERLEEEGLVMSSVMYDELKYTLTPKGRDLHKQLEDSGRSSLEYGFTITEPKEFLSKKK